MTCKNKKAAGGNQTAIKCNFCQYYLDRDYSQKYVECNIESWGTSLLRLDL
jgi:hypothetical protein